MLRVPTTLVLAGLALLCSCGAPEIAAPPTIPPPQPPASATATPRRVPTPLTTPTIEAARSTALPAPAPVHAVQLPLDQPWIWSDGALTAIGADGHLTELVQPVLATIERAGQPPLLIARADDQSLTLIDSANWVSHSLPLPAGTSVSGPFAWSPDQSEVAVITFGNTPTIGPKTGYQIYRVDVQRGTARLVLEQLGGNAIYDPPEPVAWGAQGLLVRVQSSATSVFWQVDLSQAPAAARPIVTIGETGGWSVDDRGRFLAHRYSGQAPLVRNLATGAEREITGSTPAIAPDGSQLAYVSPRSDTPSGCCTLHIEPTDDRDGATTSLVLVAPDSETVQLAWTSDGTRQLIIASRSAFAQAGGIENIGRGRLWVVRPDGTLVGSVTLRDAESLRLTHDDQVVVVERGEPLMLAQIDLRTSAPTLSARLPENSTGSAPWVVYAPPAPIPPAPSSADGAEALQQYPNDAFGVAFAFPASWRPSARSMDRYDGDTGFVSVGAGLTGGMWTIQSACEHEAGHKLRPYGSAPKLEYLTIDHQPACLIWPSADQDPGFENMAELVVLAPRPITIADTSYDFLILSADTHHLRTIASTIQLHQS